VPQKGAVEGMSLPRKEPQQELPMFQVDPADPNIVWLENYLLAHQDWLTARHLAVIAGKDDGIEAGRWVRALAQESCWVISGQKGYKHLQHATAEEVKRFVAWMESQAKKMIERAERMRRNAHTIFG
jgi:hypothetical protein